jgi:predicted DNA binding CopG/RHH family protein
MSKHQWFSLNFNTTQGRITWLAFFFLMVFLLFTFLIYWQESELLKINQKTVTLRQPITITTYQIINGINESNSAQLIFFRSKDEKQKNNRQKIWDSEVKGNFKKLYKIRPELSKIEQAYIDSLQILLPDYENLMIKIDSYFIDNQQELKKYQDTTNLNNLLIKEKKERFVSAQIEYLFSKKRRPLRLQIQTILKNLVKNQETYLNSDFLEIKTRIEGIRQFIWVFMLSAITLMLSIGYLAIRKSNQSVKKINRQVKKLAEGDLADTIQDTKDDFSSFIPIVNQLILNLRKAAQFALEVGKGNFKADFEAVGERDSLGNALLTMRNQLLTASEEDKKRNWAAEGLTKLADLLRVNQNTQDLCNTFLSFLAKYLNVQQGSLFLVKKIDWSGDVHLALESAYACSPSLLNNKRFEPNEGLIGQVYQNRKMLILNEIQESYLQISSGLGEKKAGYLVIIPLIFNEQVEAVLELASFQSLENYQISFIQKAGENLAAILAMEGAKGNKL